MRSAIIRVAPEPPKKVEHDVAALGDISNAPLDEVHRLAPT
jgi:hypothetical protein